MITEIILITLIPIIYFIVGYLVHERTSFRFEKVWKYFKDLYSYFKDREEINHNYGYAIKEGFCSDESYNWRKRLHYYYDSMAYEPEEIL